MLDTSNPESVLALLMVLVAGAFEKVPPLKGWLDKFEPWQKQVIMAVVPLGLVLVVYAAACYVPGISLQCPDGGLSTVASMVLSWVLAWLTGQGTHYGLKTKTVIPVESPTQPL